MAKKPTLLTEVTLDPHELQQFTADLMDPKQGYPCNKIKSGKGQLKRMFFDRMCQRVFYSPSNKSFADSSFLFKDICVVSTKKEDAPGVTEGFPLFLKSQNMRSAVFSFDVEAHRDEVAQCIALYTRQAQQGIDEDPFKARLYELWMRADANGDNNLVFEELQDLLHGLNINMDDKTLDKQFKMYDDNNSGALCFKEFTKLYQALTEIEVLRPFFHKFSKNEEIIHADGLKEFFKQAFAETLDDEAVDGLINAYSANKKPQGLSFREFTTFLLDTKTNSCFNPAHEHRIYQDMNQPLTNYFINSSHNTYLSGDQLTSKSDPDMYSMALTAGCRCVELDCWDGPGEDPIVYHGYTRTSKIRFQAVCNAINASAFTTSDYPVILSLENHCSTVQSGVMAKILRSTFGNQILTAKEYAETKEWTPEGLANRILIKWKASAADPDDTKDTEGAEEIEKAKAAEEGKQTESKNSASKYAKSGKEDLMALVTCAAHHSKNWGEDASPNWITSYNEGKVNKFFSESKEDFIKCNTKMLSRTYPAGSRINSSNYDPFPAWEMGAQVVALNYQTWDGPLRMYAGKFRQNGRTGYILKPEHLRTGGPAPSEKWKLKVTVILGTQLPKPEGDSDKSEIIDPYVEVQVRGTKADTEANKVCTTKTIDDNGFNPVWNETFEFNITDLSLALLTFRVLDKDTLSKDDEIGEFTVPVESLRLGYRAVPLYGCQDGDVMNHAALLCHFSLKKE